MRKILFFIATLSLLRMSNVIAQEITEEQQQRLNQILDVATSIENPADMPFRIELLKQALSIVTKKARPKFWALLKFELARSFAQNPLEDRAESLEQAIIHFQSALEVFTREADPRHWAATHNNLGNVYSERIRDDRAQNIERAIEQFNLAMQVHSREAVPDEWARIQNNLGNAYSSRILGVPADNLEQAIGHFQAALEIYNRADLSVRWAMTQTNLGTVYRKRIRGIPAENIERAITHYQLALKVLIKENFPELWAITQMNLGLAYGLRIREERAENLEQALNHLQAALETTPREAYPEEWAKIQISLGITYCDRIHGNRSENIELAIKHFNLALQILTREAFPWQWAETQGNLATAYMFRIREDRAENQEQAIAHYQSSLEVFTKNAFPEKWAGIQHNLANAYNERIRENRYENLEKSIFHYLSALEITTRQAFPVQWAETHLNLSNVYWIRIHEDHQTENLKKAIAHCQLALEVFTRENFPEMWASAQTNLGNVYSVRIGGQPPENIEKAITHYQRALEVHTREAFPVHWARIQHNLANTYRNSGMMDNKAYNLEKAIVHYHLALEVYTRESFPEQHRLASVNLGNVFLVIKRWQQAINAYNNAIDIGEELITQAAEEEVQVKALSEIQEAFRGKAYCLAMLHHPQDALQVLEQGKTRILNQFLLLRNLDAKTLSNNEDAKEFKELQQEIINLDQQLKSSSINPQMPNYTVIANELRLRREKLKLLVGKMQQHLDIETTDSWKISSLLKRIQSEKIALVEANFTSVGCVLLISLPQITQTLGDSEVEVETLFLNHFSTDSLRQLTWGDDQTKSPSMDWGKIFPNPGKDRSLWQEHQPQLLSKLGQWFWPKLDSLLQKNKIQRLLLVPQAELFLYPLHATPFIPIKTGPAQSVYPLERYTICYASSAQLYDRITREGFFKPMNDKALFVEDPDGNLGLGLSRHTWLTKALQKRDFQLTQLSTFEITSDKVLQHSSQANLIHYYGHGFYNWSTPEESGLKMYSSSGKTELLTMAQIQKKASMNQVRLVVLSACETGMTDVTHLESQDQFIGLPASFVQAGAQAVIGSLWSVPNLETSLLFSHFYRELLDSKEPISPAEALRRAQLWLMRAKPEEIEKAQTKYLGLEKGTKKLKTVQIKGPYSHPENWAGFYIMGDGFAEFK